MKNKSGNLPVYRLCSLRTGFGFKTHSIVTVVANKEAWVKTSIYAAMKDVLVCRNNTVFLPNRTSMAEKYSLKRLFRELIVWLCADANNLDLNNIFVDIKHWIKYLFFKERCKTTICRGKGRPSCCYPAFTEHGRPVLPCSFFQPRAKSW